MCQTIIIVCELLLAEAVLNSYNNETDLFCFRLDKNSAVNCTWSPSNKSLNNSAYVFYWKEKDSNKPFHITTLLPSVILERKNLSAGKSYAAWVEIQNTVLTSLEFIIDDIVKPQPPASVSAKPEDSTVIGIEWMKPPIIDSSASFQFELQYRMEGQKYWNEVSRDEIEVQAIDYYLEDLQPFTKYQFRVRCGRDGETNKKLWSDWSAVTSAMTLEANPVGMLDIWFMEKGLGRIILLWKPLEKHQAQGIIDRYSVSEWDGEEMIKMTNITCCNISLCESTQLVTVTAYNSVGSTEPAQLNLVQDQPPVLNITVHNRKEQVHVCWEAPAKKVLEFVVEWTNMNLPEQPSEWKKMPALNECIALRNGVLQPLIPYKVSVYTRYQNGLGGPVFTIYYAKEGVPLTGPQVSVYNISQTSATLLWAAIPLSLRQGFILYYTLYWLKQAQEDSKQKVLNISSALHNFTLLNLEPATTYEIWMTASTNGGEGIPGPTLKLNTRASRVEIWKQIVLIVVTMAAFFLCIFFGKCCFHQRIKRLSPFLIPQWCRQRIPDPEIIRTLLQQNSITLEHFGMIENDPEIVNVEEMIPETLSQDPLATSNSPVLAKAESSNTKDLLQPSKPIQDTDSSQKTSIHLYNQLHEQPISTKPPERTCFIFDYEKHFIPSEEDIINDEWQLDRKEQWLGQEEYELSKCLE